MSTSLFAAIIVIILTVTCESYQAAVSNNINIHFFVIFSHSVSPSPVAANESDDDTITANHLAIITSKLLPRIFDQYNRPTSSHTFRVSFTTAIQEATPLGIVKLHSALKAENFQLKSPLLRRRFIIIIGRGTAIQQALVAVRTAFSSLDPVKYPASIFTYDVDFFNHANVIESTYQLNQDRRTLVAPLLASTVLHKSNPKGGLVVLIHDVILASDQLYIAAHSLFNTLVLVTDDQSEDVVASNLKNEIAPILSNVLFSQTIPAATFVVHVANSRSVAKIFAAANRINLLGHKYVWIISDMNVFVAKRRNSNESILRQPVKPHLLPQTLIGLHADRKQLFEIALTRLLSGIAKSLATSLPRKSFYSRRQWHRFARSGNLPVARQIDVSFVQMFEADGSVISGNRRGGGRYYSEDAKFVTAVQVSADRLARLRLDKVSLRNVMQSNATTTVTAATNLLTAVDKEMILAMKNSTSTTTPSSENSELVITDGGTADDVIPHLLQVYIALGPPFLFEKPLSPVTGECQGPSSVVCDRIVPGAHEQVPQPTLHHRCCSGLVPDLVRTLSKDLKVNARIVVSAVGGEAITNTSMALDLLNRRAVDMVFTADPYIGHRSITRYYVTDPYFTSSYAMMVAIRRKEPSLLAFLSPFPISVWIGIIMMLAPVTALSISQFEWHSPFGLNPWGRKRSTNYTLGSALNMVYALLFGHTIKTKCPKAWPSKWTQNFWAGFAIFVIASYTGNLASFLAKRHESVEFESIYDLADSPTAKVGVVSDDPILSWLRLAEADLAAKLVVVNSLEDAVRRLRHYEFDVVIGELATLRYWQLTDDANICSTKLLPRTFADRELAPAMLVDSQFRATVAGKMREYRLMGEFEQLVSKNRFVSISLQGGGTACGLDQAEGIGGAEWARQAADTQLTLNHANGLFLAMIVAIVACCFILIGEHLTYYWVVPKLRNKKRTSFWRGFTFMYLSQRLYRILNSEELLRPTQILKEMIEVIKRLEFSRMFQKSARKKRFRKITIAEFVQQVKDEKEKTLPDIVVQTKGLHRAKKAWKSPLKGIASRQTSSSIEESASAGGSHYRKGVIRTSVPEKTPSVSSAERPDRSRLLSVQHQYQQTSPTSSLSALRKQDSELMLKKPFLKPSAKVEYSKSSAIMYDKRTSLLSPKCNPRITKSDASDKTIVLAEASASATRWAARPPKLAPITDLTPQMRWQWLRTQLSSNRAKSKRKTMISVYKEEMDKLVAGKTRLEQTVAELTDQLEQVKRERDRLFVVQELEESSV